MNKCKIYVEGIADQKFIADFISFHYNVSMIKVKFKDGKQIKNENLIDIEGKDSLHAVTPLLKINSAKNISNIIIFDADDNIESRRKELRDFKNENDVEFDFFLFPNDKDNGELEELLVNIINSENKGIFDCWDNYENCLKKISSDMTLPAKKTKIYAYLEPLHGKSKSQKKKIKEENRNYKNEKHWVLNNSYLNPLKTFLDKYFV